MDKLTIFNNEELLELYAKVLEEIDHLKQNIIIEEEESNVDEESSETELENSEENSKTEKEEEENE